MKSAHNCSCQTSANIYAALTSSTYNMYNHLCKSCWSAAVYLIFFIVTITAAPAYKKERNKLPSFIKVCRRSDPQLSVCARNSMEALKERLTYGIPELFIPPVDPLVVPEIKMDQDSGAIYLHSTYKNIKVHGLSNFTLNEFIIDPHKLKFTMSMSCPNVTMDAHYTMKGKIMMMPLMGEGKFNANFTNVDLSTVISAQRYKKNGRTFIKVKDIKVQYTLSKAQLHLENLFNGDKALGERMNSFLNENWESLSEEIRPLLENAMADIVRASTVKLFDAYSLDDLLPE